MLKELRNPRQIPGEPRRRWFQDESCELIVWLGDGQDIYAFQWCYDKGTSSERVLTWADGKAFSHERIDSGEDHPLRYKGSPVLIADGLFDAASAAENFLQKSLEMDGELAAFVAARLAEYM